MERYLTIQEHNAVKAGLHWDLRLSYNDRPSEQMSWVIPKHRFPGQDRLLAVNVDDHPWSYRNFEGELKNGYGKGTVKLIFSGWIKVEEMSDKKIKFIYNKVNYRLVKGPQNKWFWFAV